ncbi:MAG: hypothetical protein AB1374_13530 [Bacillota bacterium]
MLNSSSGGKVDSAMPPEIFIGTSGYSYDDWRGVLYPLRLAKGKMLARRSRTRGCCGR